MSDSAYTDHLASPSAQANIERGPRQRSWLATLVGAIAGALAFALCTLWLGALAGMVIALASTLLALARRRLSATIAFVATGTLCTFALRPSTALVLVAALVYGGGLALAAKRSRSADVLA